MKPHRSPAFWAMVSLAFGALFALLVVQAAAAHSPMQTAGSPSAAVSSLDLGQFPAISGQLRAYQADGAFVDSLDSAQVIVIEHGQRLPVTSLTHQRPGAQFVLAILGGSDLAFKDSEGLSRLDYLLQGVDGWLGSGTDGEGDDLSLVVQGGTELLHQRNTSDWLQAVRDIDEDILRQANPDMQILSRAVETAAASPPNPGMGKALLVITPAMRTSEVTGLQNLAATARQQGVRVYVWLVASQEYGSSILSNGWRLLAAETGGAFFNYSGVESIPDVQAYLEPLRQIYDFSYESAIRSSGIFTLSVEIQSETVNLQTPPLEFAIQVTAPNPIFVSLPLEITRTFTGDSPATASLGQLPDFEPDSHPVRFLVEFSDGIQRDILKSTLLVNDEVVAINETTPFDQFTWDLSEYTENTQVMVKVEVVDELGLNGASAEFPVKITVIGPPPPPPTAIMLTPQGALALLLSAVALGAIVGLVLLISGRLQLARRPVTGKGGQAKRAASEIATIPLAGTSTGKASSGPSTKPLASQRAPTSGLPGWMGRIQRRMQPAKTDAPNAYLTPIAEDEEEAAAAPPLPINADETILGSEITWTTWAIRDPSLAPVHARLRREGANFRLYDEKTVGGTWVNYTAVPPEGVLLAHGDAIHFGRVGFRFRLRGGSAQKPVVTPLKHKHPF